MPHEFKNNLEIEISRIVEDLTREVIDHIRALSLSELLGEDGPVEVIEAVQDVPEEPPRRKRGRPRKVREPSEPAGSSAPSSRTDAPSTPTPFFAQRAPVAPPPKIGPSFAERRKMEETARLKSALVEVVSQNPGSDAKTAAEKVRAPLGEVQKHLDDLVFSGALKMTSGHHGRCYHPA